jgi:hypothetical protein
MKSLTLPIFLLPLFLSAQTTALFLGNSYTASNNLPGLTEQLAASAGFELTTAANTPGGFSFEGHTTNTASQNLIAQGGWDFVVLQEQSQIPSFPLAQVETDCFPYAAQLNEQILAADSCAETVFYMTWGRENGDSQNCANWPPVCTYEGMDDLLYERYMTMAEENEALVSPVGRVWRYLRENNPGIDLYSSDGSHPSLAGSYAAACCFFTAFFREDPTQITDNSTLDATTAEAIRDAVKTVVFDELATWFIGSYDIVPTFTATPVTATSCILINTTPLPEGSTSSWDFGFTVVNGDTVLVEFPSTGEFPVTLTVTTPCKTGTVSDVLDVGTIQLNEHEWESLQIYPNPSNGRITFQRPPHLMNHPLEVRDLTGRLITICTESFLELEPGMYFIAGRRVVVER